MTDEAAYRVLNDVTLSTISHAVDWKSYVYEDTSELYFCYHNKHDVDILFSANGAVSVYVDNRQINDNHYAVPMANKIRSIITSGRYPQQIDDDGDGRWFAHVLIAALLLWGLSILFSVVWFALK